MFSHGNEVITYFEKLLKELVLNEDTIVVQPVSLLILDTNLFGMNGIETMQKVREMYKLFNRNFTQATADPENSMVQTDIPLIRPLMCYLSQHGKADFPQMQTDGRSETTEIECYMKRPLRFDDLAALLKLLYLT